MSGQQASQQASLQGAQHPPSSVGAESCAGAVLGAAAFVQPPVRGAAAAVSGTRAPKAPKEKEKERKKASKHGAPWQHPQHTAHEARQTTPAPALVRKDSGAIFQVRSLGARAEACKRLKMGQNAR